MPNKVERRHSRWYEVIAFSDFFQLLLSYSLIVLVPNWLRWGEQLLLWPFSTVQLSTLLINSAAFLLSFIVLRKLSRFPGTRVLHYIIPIVVLAWALVFSLSAFILQASYSKEVLLSSFGLALAVSVLSYVMDNDYYKPKLALVPFGRALGLADCKHGMITVLDAPDLGKRRYNAIVADLHDVNLAPQWQQFLAQCTLAGVPVYHFQQVKEALTGRVQINHLAENTLGSLQPSVLYSGVKRAADFLAVFLLLPFIIPIMLVTAIAIALDSKGGVFYNQQRMGHRGKPFTMYKFRSMRTDIEGKGFTEGEEDPRITRVGRFIRKYRIDELPQVLNVLKGEMSFIGPRPESAELSKWYEKDVPFFSYRHIVRPGLSGWAQVEQGYAAEVDGMTVKLQYDFYYIKHFSLWLDLLVVAKTIRTICTGFGAR